MAPADLMILHHTSGRSHFERFFKGNATSTLVALPFGRFDETHYQRIREAYRIVERFRDSVADIEKLDAAARGQARRATVEHLIHEAPAVAPKPVNARVAGEDIRRFIPRRT